MSLQNHYAVRTQQPTSRGWCSERVLRQDEIEATFPHTYADQAFLSYMLECYEASERSAYQRVAGMVGIFTVSATGELSRMEQEQAGAAAAFESIVWGGLTAVKRDHQVRVYVQPKAIERTWQKTVVYDFRSHKSGKPAQPVFDHVQAEVLAADERTRDQVRAELKTVWGLPDTYPGDYVSEEVGVAPGPVSAADYPASRLIVPYEYQRQLHIAELRIFSPRDLAKDDETRPNYLARRSQEFDEAWQHRIGALTTQRAMA